MKIIEAAAYGKAVVATKIEAEGLGLYYGQKLFLGDDAEPLTEACLQLLRDHALCERKGLLPTQKRFRFMIEKIFYS